MCWECVCLGLVIYSMMGKCSNYTLDFGEPNSVLYFFFKGGGVLWVIEDLQRYITATRVCTTCFMQALNKDKSLYRIYPIIIVYKPSRLCLSSHEHRLKLLVRLQKNTTITITIITIIRSIRHKTSICHNTEA